MPEKEVIVETMETVETAAKEVAQIPDKRGIILMGLGFIAGTGITIGAAKGVKFAKRKISERRAKKSVKKIEMVAEEAK